MIHLRGMTWNHPRGIDPLIAASESFRQTRPDISITWDARSLEDFEDYPVDVLTRQYDLVNIDHPFIGTGVAKGVLLPLSDWLPADYLADQQMNSVGRSYDSYTWEGKQWALAGDAASQVAVYRQDLLDQLGAPVPGTWEEVKLLASETAAGSAPHVGIPLNPTHAYCSFLALSANIGGEHFWDEQSGIDPEIGQEALNVLFSLLPLLHPSSLKMNPIEMSDLMSDQDQICYVPLMFGYSNYAKLGFRSKLLSFANVPLREGIPLGGVLGGVGLAVSSSSLYKREAVDLAAYIASEECQSGLYVSSGGQPGHRAAWRNEQVNANCGGFFQNTLPTLDHAYVRPRMLNYPKFQRQAGELIHAELCSNGSAKEVIIAVNKLYSELIR